MSTGVSAAQTDFDFWEFVTCTRCQLPFASGSGATTPFWLTECGHVVCNSHLNTDQSCAKCGSQGIQLIPLQRQMDAPMSDWFRSVPHALDGIAFAAKFQQETMAAQIRHYKSKYQQHRVFIDRLKKEAAQLKKVNEVLTHEVSQLRQHVGYQGQPRGGREDREPSDIINPNGKRQMIETQHYGSSRPRTSSSPRSIITPLGPNRLTLPPGQQPPNFSSNRPDQGEDGPSAHPHPHASGSNGVDTYEAQQRPGSGRFIEQYAYIPPSTPQFHAKQLSHTQVAPRPFQRTKVNEAQQQQHPSQTQGQRAMLPPPPRFKPSQGRIPLVPSQKANTSVRSNQSQAQSQHQNQNNVVYQDSRQKSMGPPPTPQQMELPPSFGNAAGQQPNGNPPRSSSRRPANTLPASSRFLPPDQRFAPPGPIGNQNQRFVPSTPSTGAPHRFFPANGSFAPSSGLVSGSRAPSRAAASNLPGGGQRMPFIPRESGGFG